MKRLFILSAIGTAMLMVVLPSWASINLNSSRSNVYRLVYDANLVSQAQGDALGKELDKIGPADETKLKAWLAENYRRFGIDGTRVKEIDVFLEQQISCTVSAATCKGKWKGPALNARSKGDCFCYEPITTPTQVQQVSKERPIVIFLLSNPNQQADAFAKADDAASMEKNPAYIRSREQARQILLGKGGNSSAARRNCCCYFIAYGGKWGWCAVGDDIALTQF